MEALRRQMSTIAKYLGTLTVLQKLLIAALVVVAVLSLALVAITASRTSLVELLPGVSTDQQTKAKAFLDSMNITYRAEGGRLMVPPEQRPAVLAALGEAGAMPADSRLLFTNLASTRSWLTTKSQNEQDYNTALTNELSLVISKFRGVRSAQVFIDAPDPVGLGMAYRKPVASVMVTMENARPLSREAVDAIAAMVSGAKAGLAVSDVKVIDGNTGRQFSARDPGEARTGDYMEHVAAIEGRVQGKLMEQLAYIRGVMVAVNAQVDIRQMQATETRYLPSGLGSTAIVSRESTSTRSTAEGSGGPGEAGLRSNVAEDINRGPAGPVVTSSEETSEADSKVGLGSREERTLDPRGMPTRINVTVNVPREYVARLIKAKAAAGAAAPPAGGPEAEPSDADLQNEFKAEKARLEMDIAPLVETAAADPASGVSQPQAGRVVVSMIPVPLLAGAPEGASQTAGLLGAGGGVGDLLGGGMVKNLALGGLAVLAVGMMLLVVRKASKPAVLPKPEDVVGLPPQLDGTSDIVGEADETQTAMEGIELDDNELRNKKMLESVTELVRKAPGDSAKILNRWVVASEV